MSATVALLSDFGTLDPCVGVMKAVMRGICPAVTFIDLTHEVEAQDVRQAAFLLLTSRSWFPRGTIFLVVVDPGVGSARRPLVVSAGGYYFVAPDNGVLSWALAEMKVDLAVCADDPKWHLAPVSNTFHGRDVFAPLAAQLANGRTLTELGTPISDLQQLPAPLLETGPGEFHAEVLHVDCFGNLATSLGALQWAGQDELRLEPRFGDTAACVLPAESAGIRAGKLDLQGVKRTFSSVKRGEALACVGSSGFLELAVNQGDAASLFGLKPGDRIAGSW